MSVDPRRRPNAATPILWAERVALVGESNESDSTKLLSIRLSRPLAQRIQHLFVETDRETMVALAKDILRALAPTVEDEILASLHRIEGRLAKTE